MTVAGCARFWWVLGEHCVLVVVVFGVSACWVVLVVAVFAGVALGWCDLGGVVWLVVGLVFGGFACAQWVRGCVCFDGSVLGGYCHFGFVGYCRRFGGF